MVKLHHRSTFAPKSIFFGCALILFLIFAEAIAVARTFQDIPRFFTAHIIIDLFPTSLLNTSSLYLLGPALLFLFFALLPAKNHKINTLSLIFIIIGLSFFPLAFYIPNVVPIGPLWGILFFPWLGVNLWFRDLDYFYASVLGIFLWDIGAGIQGLIFNISGLPEPYGNNIPPLTVTVIDVVLIVFTGIIWRLRINILKLFKIGT